MQAHMYSHLNMLALVRRIQPLESELSAAKLHRISVRIRLAKAFSVVRVQNIGSHCRGTAIKRFSDLDLMVAMRKEEVMWGGKIISSDTVIQKLLTELRERFPASSIRKDGLAATVTFGGTRQSLDVVPAIFTRFHPRSLRPVYLIPDGEGGWFETSPQVHDRYFSAAQEASGNKLNRVSQLVKAWKHARADALPIRSFYTDMVLASRGICTPAKTYGQCLQDFFQELALRSCSALEDPCGVAGEIAATDTEVQRQTLLASVQYSSIHAEAAMNAQARSDSHEANRHWNLVFNGCF